MYLATLLTFMIIIVFINFVFLLVGSRSKMRKQTEEVLIRIGSSSYSLEKFVIGVSTSVFGIVWFFAWMYFLSNNWNSFWSQRSWLSLHVALQLLTSIILFFSGVSVFREWKGSRGLFLFGMLLLIGSVAIALLIYSSHASEGQLYMYLLAGLTLVLFAFLILAFRILDGPSRPNSNQFA